MFEELFRDFLALLEKMRVGGDGIAPSTGFDLNRRSTAYDRKIQGALERGIGDEREAVADIKALEADLEELAQRRNGVKFEYQEINKQIALAKKNTPDDAKGLAELNAQAERVGAMLDLLNKAHKERQGNLSSLQHEIGLLNQRIELISFQTDCNLNELDGKTLCDEIESVLNSPILLHHPDHDALLAEFKRLLAETKFRLKRIESRRFKEAQNRLQPVLKKMPKLMGPTTIGKDPVQTCTALATQRMILIELGASEMDFQPACISITSKTPSFKMLVARAAKLKTCHEATKWQIDANTLDAPEVLGQIEFLVLEDLPPCIPIWIECQDRLDECIRLIDLASIDLRPVELNDLLARLLLLEMDIKTCALDVSRRTQKCLSMHIDAEVKARQDEATFDKLRGKKPLDDQGVRDAVGSQSLVGFDAELALKQLCADYPSLDAVIAVIGEMFSGSMSDVHRAKRDAILACLDRHHGEFVHQFFQIDTKNELVQPSNENFKIFSACADGKFNDPVNLGKYTFHLTTLGNLLLKVGITPGQLAGIAKEGLISSVGGKDGGASQAAADGRKTFGVSMEHASRTNSRLKVASTSNRSEGMKVYDKMFEDKADAALKDARERDAGEELPLKKQGNPLDLVALGKLPIQLRFPIRAEYLGCFDNDPIHLTSNLFLLNGVEVPAEDIEALVFNGWVHISHPAFIEAYMDLFLMQEGEPEASAASSSEPNKGLNNNNS